MVLERTRLSGTISCYLSVLTLVYNLTLHSTIDKIIIGPTKGKRWVTWPLFFSFFSSVCLFFFFFFFFFQLNFFLLSSVFLFLIFNFYNSHHILFLLLCFVFLFCFLIIPIDRTNPTLHFSIFFIFPRPRVYYTS
jgi:hypothetical protein